MADEDDFDIDIYGDDKPEFVAEPKTEPKTENRPPISQDDSNAHHSKMEHKTESPLKDIADHQRGAVAPSEEPSTSPNVTMSDAPPVADTVGSANNSSRQGQMVNDGVEGDDQRPVDAGATLALKLTDLQWWTTEDDVRGWANRAGAEDELNEITFSEHKINGKSKGEAFVDLQSPQAATVMKRYIEETFSTQPAAKRVAVSFAPHEHNPFKSYPKDALNRNRDSSKDRPVNSYSNQSYNNQTGFRGGRGGYNRGNFHSQSRSGYTNNHNNNGQMGMGGGFGGMNNMNTMGGMGMGSYNNNNMGFNRGGGGGGGMMSMNRGGFQSNRGGRGAMMGNNMGMMPGMGMGGMGMGMGMDMGMGAMGAMNPMGFGGFSQGQFNQQQQQQQHFGGNSTTMSSNPHGAKRQRPE